MEVTITVVMPDGTTDTVTRVLTDDDAQRLISLSNGWVNVGVDAYSVASRVLDCGVYGTTPEYTA